MSLETEASRSLGSRLAIFVFLVLVNSLLARFAVLAQPGAPGIAAIYFAVAFMIAFALWFGMWGAIAAYLGCFVGAGLSSGVPAGVGLYWSLADLWQTLIPLVAFKKLHADISLGQRRDVWIFFVFGCVLNNLIGAIWGASTLAVGGVSSWNGVTGVLLSWFAGNLIVTLAITPLLLRYVTPHIQQAGIQVREYWS